MAPPSKLPDVKTLVQMYESGMTHAEIAAEYGVTRTAVTLKLKGATEPRLWRRDWPWDVQTRHKTGWLYEAVSFYVMDLTKDRILSERQRSRVDTLLGALDKLTAKTGVEYVIDYDPETPVGFWFRPRRESDPKGSVLGGGDGAPAWQQQVGAASS